MQTILGKWEKEWWLKGREEGSADTVIQVLRTLFGRLGQATERKIRALPAKEVPRLVAALPSFKSAANVQRWLQSQAGATASSALPKRPRA